MPEKRQAHYVKPQNRLLQAIARARAQLLGSIPYNPDPLLQPNNVPLPASLPSREDRIQPDLQQLQLEEGFHALIRRKMPSPGTLDQPPIPELPTDRPGLRPYELKI